MSKSNPEFVVGMDLSDRKITICVLDAAGEVQREETIANQREALLEAFCRFPQAGRVRVAMETGTHSPWISSLLEESGYRVLVGNARRLRAIWAADNKNDVRDAEMLARIARFDPKLLSPITHRGKAAQMDLAQLKARGMLVKTRASLVNFVRGTLKAAGVALRACSTESFAKLVRAENREALLEDAINPLLATIEALSAQIRAYDRQLARLSREKYPETASLRQIAGVGPVTALAYVLTLEHPDRFAKSRHVGPYLGLVPQRDQSGEADRPRGITKAGNALLRHLLVGAANYILGPFGPDCDLRRHGERIARRGGAVAKRKAKVAVARKLAVLLHHLWRTDDAYEPLRHGQGAQAA